MRLETERLIIRPFEQQDHARMAKINADSEVMRYFPSPYTREQTQEKIIESQEAVAKDGFYFVAAELKETRQCIGIIGLRKTDELVKSAIPNCPDIEIGWRLSKEVWGQGLATEGARACLNYAWTTLAVTDVVAVTTLANTPSMRVMEKIGMTHDQNDVFEHPYVQEGHPMRQHVIYRIKNPNLL